MTGEDQPAPSALDELYPEVWDLSACEKEPIQVPGTIQPHGVLIAFTDPELPPICFSANIEAFTGTPPEVALEQKLSARMTGASFARLTAVLSAGDLPACNPVCIDLLTQNGERDFDGILHQHDGLTFLELEPRGQNPRSSSDFFRGIRAAIRRLQSADDLASGSDIVAQEVRRITGFDRVKVYRFAPDWTGQVIAEAKADFMPSFYDFCFPTSDIPSQARALYTKNLIRIIPDIGYTPSPLVPNRNPLTGGPVDLSFALLRSISPMHVEYMENMAVYGAMSVSILRNGQLWGMISCHNKLPRFVAYEIRQACELIAQVLTWQIGVMEESAIIHHSARGRAVQNRLLHELDGARDLYAGLGHSSEELLEMLDASGLALFGADGVTVFGRTPTADQIVNLVNWLDRDESGDVFETDRLSALFPDAAEYAEIASGVLAVPLGRTSPSLMLWFRTEVAQTVTWGGDPHNPVHIGPHGDRLQTRASFAAWQEEVRGRSRPWQAHEVVAAVEIRDLVVDVILSKAEELERVNSLLERSNEELESFAYVASHDLKEPLRHIEAFAGLLKEVLPVDPDGRLGTMVEGIEVSSRRLRALINDLAEYSRVGRQARPMEGASLDDIIKDVLADLGPVVQETRAKVSVQALPVVLCDSMQIRQVFQNLLSNALKYRDRTRVPEIVVSVVPEADSPPSIVAAHWRHVRIAVQDNGIGFDEKYSQQIFEPFQRLHGPDEYEGTGIGLAICRKIVQRHGGSISATSRIGVGSCFTFTLPLCGLDS